jgi:hypothetical protein
MAKNHRKAHALAAQRPNLFRSWPTINHWQQTSQRIDSSEWQNQFKNHNKIGSKIDKIDPLRRNLISR